MPNPSPACQEVLQTITKALNGKSRVDNLKLILELSGCTVGEKYAYYLVKQYEAYLADAGIAKQKNGKVISFTKRTK